MDMEKKRMGYCFNCNAMVDYEEFEEEVNEIINGARVTFMMKYCPCKECGDFVSVPSIDEENQNRLTAAIKKCRTLM